MPQSWNNGIVERWNSGFSKDIIHFKLYRQDEFCHLPNIAVSSPSRRPRPIFPIFQHSTIPIGAKPLTCCCTNFEILPAKAMPDGIIGSRLPKQQDKNNSSRFCIQTRWILIIHLKCLNSVKLCNFYPVFWLE